MGLALDTEERLSERHCTGRRSWRRGWPATAVTNKHCCPFNEPRRDHSRSTPDHRRDQNIMIVTADKRGRRPFWDPQERARIRLTTSTKPTSGGAASRRFWASAKTSRRRAGPACSSATTSSRKNCQARSSTDIRRRREDSEEVARPQRSAAGTTGAGRRTRRSQGAKSAYAVIALHYDAEVFRSSRR